MESPQHFTDQLFIVLRLLFYHLCVSIYERTSNVELAYFLFCFKNGCY
jgi:hypothetical protein